MKSQSLAVDIVKSLFPPAELLFKVWMLEGKKVYFFVNRYLIQLRIFVVFYSSVSFMTVEVQSNNLAGYFPLNQGERISLHFSSSSVK